MHALSYSVYIGIVLAEPFFSFEWYRKLEFATEYNAGKIAVINIRDFDGVTNAINVITPDGPKIFQCGSPAAKVRYNIFMN